MGGLISMYKLLLLIITIYVSSLSAQHRTPDYYKCSNRIGGSWIFGKAPYACDSSAFGDDLFAFQNYSDFIFSDQRLSSEERIAYMSRMHKAIKKVLSWYLLERNPEVSASEQALWQQAIFEKLHQESFWSHYRLSDQNILKHMRGDFGHGHGIGQIDDRWHFVQIDNGVGWDLFENLVYGLDVFYREWQRAAKARCVSSPISVDRVRAAYSAYNGGPSQICRWVNPDHRWARNDKNFYQKFQARQWERYIQNDYTISVDPICLVKKERGCRVDNGKTTFEEGDLLKIDNSKICVVKNENLECLENTEDLACMSALDSKVSDSAMEVSFEEIKEYNMKIFDRYKTCKAAQPALTNIGGFILLKKSINLRKTPGGGYLTVALKDSIVEVLDFYINIPLTKNFYYKIKYNLNLDFRFKFL